MNTAEAPLLEVRDLRTYFFTKTGVVKAVDGVSFTVAPGETLGIVGESGSGKSVTVLSILRLVAEPGRIVGGDIRLEGESLLAKTEREMASIRGNRIAMVFQDPMTSLNPVLTVGDQIAEVLTTHRKLSKRAARARAAELLAMVGIPDPHKRLDAYPHEFSGGMRQRVMIAMALACQPKLLIADEPTTALDVTIQVQILELIRRLQEELGMAVILITHDLGVVAEVCDRVLVMYAGRPVEEADVRTLFASPRHPYTVGLLGSLPRLDGNRNARLTPIPGGPPDMRFLPPGCSFHPRCPLAEPRCREQRPELRDLGGGHWVACHAV
ncbi:ABC transporter ATP-binding protein [Calditerricola satsumensis]|uniref:ABC transporter ATP-binding protein n=1 Tax=Calditerricola satsumensis TaxID=373054 RepID=A0A8J3BAW9_9BACI|nr:ABC transporter ATP-binding protein [Calditerricola satsumensis]GGJ91312.1 ABC transporter ATP-binding protein [Calditerricola satsumensis]